MMNWKEWVIFMKVVIVYDSQFGNTEKIAYALGDAIGAMHEVQVIKASSATVKSIEGIGLLLVGSPTHGGRGTEAVKAFLGSLPEKSLAGVRAAAFDTAMTQENQGFFIKKVIKFFGFASSRLGVELQAKGAALAGAESFGVLDREGPLREGELERAKAWAAGLV